MDNSIAILSLVFLIAAIIIGFISKINTGIVSIGLALLLGRLTGMADSEIISGFNYSLFITLFGVMFLFSIAKTNGTLELFAKKAIALCGMRSSLMPIVLFFLALILSAIGPGTIAVSALLAVLSVALSEQMNLDPIRLAPFGLLGALAGGFSPIAPTGIIAITHAENNNIYGIEIPLLLGLCIGMTAYAVILYLFVFRWQRQKMPLKREKLPRFNSKQIITLCGIACMTLLTMLFNINVGLSALAVSIVLLLLRVADESKAMAEVPLGTLILVIGVGVLMELVIANGGIDLLADGLGSIMTKRISTMLMTLMGGILSWFSSTSGVVLPTLIPIVPSISESVAGVNPVELIVGLSNGSHAAAISPLSTCGALVLAAYTSIYKPDSKLRNKMFAKLFAVSIAGVLFVTLLALLGAFSLVV